MVIPAPFAAAGLAAPLASTMLISSTVSVVLLIVVVLPFTVKSPVTTRSCPIVVVPPPSPPVPILTVVAAPPMFSVVALVLIKLNVVWLVIISPPRTSKSPLNTTLAFLIVAVPVVAPIVSAVLAPNALTVVAVVSKTFIVVVLVLNVSAVLTSPVNVALPLVSIRNLSVLVCLKSLVVLTWPVLITTSPPVALPVPMPPSSVSDPPLILLPMPSVPLIVDPTGVALASASPNTTLRFLTTMLLSILIFPAIALIGLAVTFALVRIVKLVALNVAPVTDQLPSRLVMVLPLILMVSPALTPIVNGVKVKVKFVPFNIVPVVALLRYIKSLVTPLTVVFDGILALPVTNIPAIMFAVLLIGTSVSPLAVTALVFTTTFPRFTTTFRLDVAS